jgi:tetratricopeptide (TPR) repeat protein
MTEAALPLRIFVASPGDLTSERLAIKQCVAEHNALTIGNASPKFEVVGWESVRGTARRPQEAINELIEECHYLVALFKKSWGSEPGSPWGYTSGTEEELFTGLLDLGQGDRPMRDVWVAFMSASEPALQIRELREQMSRRHAMMYESVSDAYELKEKFADRLNGWSTITPKSPRHIDLLPTSGKDVLRAASLCRDGKKLVELGIPEQGMSKLREASALGGPPENLAYAKFLARNGELDGAEEVIQIAIDYFTTGPGLLDSPLAAEVFAAQAGLFRRQGRYADAIGRLEHALRLFDETSPYAEVVRCRILDELGLASQKTGDMDGARRCFNEALRIRRGVDDSIDVGQSLVNLARLDVAAQDMDAALNRADEALARLSEIPPSALHANAHVLRAQVLLRLGRPREAISDTHKAISLNEQFGNTRGAAIAHYVAAQCYRAAGDNGEASGHAGQSMTLNDSMGNASGRDKARWILDQLAHENRHL